MITSPANNSSLVHVSGDLNLIPHLQAFKKRKDSKLMSIVLILILNTIIDVVAAYCMILHHDAV